MGDDKLPTGPVRFSTDDVAERDRIATWREVLGRVHLHLDVEPIGESPLRATVESHRWAFTSLFFSDTTPVRAARTPDLIQDGDDAFRLLYVDDGRYRFTARGCEQEIAAGSAALLFNGAVSAVSYPRPCRVTAVRLDRTALNAPLPGLAERPLHRLPPSSPPIRLLMQYVNVLRLEGPAADVPLARRTSQHLADLVVLALGACGDAAELARERGLRAARLAAIKADVVTALGDQALTVAMIAARHGISSRYVHKLFEHDGTAFSDFVLRRRLAHAHQLLRDPLAATKPIGAIAFECGFSDLSYFNRTFRRAYNATPSDIRNAALDIG